MYNEIELLFKAIKSLICGENGSSIVANIDKKSIIEFATRNRLNLFLVDIIKNRLTSKEIIDMQYEQRIATLMNDMRKYRELIAILEQKQIQYAVLKGSYLAKAAYGDFKYRATRDLDILINPDQKMELKYCLEQLGFKQGKYDISQGDVIEFTREQILYYELGTKQLAPFSKKNKNPYNPYLAVDVHMDIAEFEIIPPTDPKMILADYRIEECNNVKYRVLNYEWFFVQTCLHHYKHLNSISILSRSGYELRCFSDIYFYVFRNILCFNRDKLLKIIKQCNLGKYIYYMLFYSQILFGEAVSVMELMEQVENIADESFLNQYGVGKEGRYEWPIDFRTRMLSPNIFDIVSTMLGKEDKDKLNVSNQYLKN